MIKIDKDQNKVDKPKIVIEREEEIIEQKPSKQRKRKEKKNTDMTQIKIIGTAILFLIFSSCLYIKNQDTGPKVILERTDIVVNNETEKLSIYYPKDGIIAKEEVEITKEENENKKFENIIKEVVRKLEREVLIPKLEVEKEVFYYRVGDKIYLDLPQRVFEMVNSPKEELGLIYSFVNSLTSIEGIKKVRILINGEGRNKMKYANLSKDYSYTTEI